MANTVRAYNPDRPLTTREQYASWLETFARDQLDYEMSHCNDHTRGARLMEILELHEFDDGKLIELLKLTRGLKVNRKAQLFLKKWRRRWMELLTKCYMEFLQEPDIDETIDRLEREISCLERLINCYGNCYGWTNIPGNQE